MCNLIIIIRTVFQVMCVHGTKQLKLTIWFEVSTEFYGGSTSAVMWWSVTKWRVDGMWHFVTGLLLPNVSYENGAFIFKYPILLEHLSAWRWRQKNHLRHQETPTHQHSVTSQKTQILKCGTMIYYYNPYFFLWELILSSNFWALLMNGLLTEMFFLYIHKQLPVPVTKYQVVGNIINFLTKHIISHAWVIQLAVLLLITCSLYHPIK